MTWLGKILTFVVMLAAVVGAYLTVQGFVTRTNWKSRADGYEAAFKQSETARRDEDRRYQAESDALRRQLAVAEKRATDLSSTNKELAKAVESNQADFAKLQGKYGESDVTAVQQGANLAATVGELKTVRDRNADLENTAVALRLETENAKKEEVKAKNGERIALALAKDFSAKIEELTARLSELRQQAGGGPGAVPRSLDKPAPPLLPNTRGEVTEVSGDFLVVSIGIDAGLAPNTVLEVSRADGTYLGTAKVNDVQGLFPKQAIVTFTPKAGNVPLDRLPAGSLPRKGDLVRPQR